MAQFTRPLFYADASFKAPPFGLAVPPQAGHVSMNASPPRIRQRQSHTKPGPQTLGAFFRANRRALIELVGASALVNGFVLALPLFSMLGHG